MKRKKYIGIQRKVVRTFLVTMSIGMLLCIILFAVQLGRNTVQNRHTAFVEEVQASTASVDYQLKTCISSARSLYDSYKTLLHRIMAGDSEHISVDNELALYFRNISDSSPFVEQIQLYLPNNSSYLYDCTTLRLTYFASTMQTTPTEGSSSDIFYEPTHQMYRYYKDGFRASSPEYAFSIWIPLANLPATTKASAWLSLDIPSTFLLESMGASIQDERDIYIADCSFRFMASSNAEYSFLSLNELLPSNIEVPMDGCFGGGYYYVAQSNRSTYLPLVFLAIIPISSLYSSALQQLLFSALIAIGCVLVVTLFNMFYISKITKPLRRTTEYMSELVSTKEWNTAQLAEVVQYEYNDEISSLIGVLDIMIRNMEKYTIREYQLELAEVDTTLKMLQAQINPHFMYNTIQCFATNALMKDDYDQYERLASFGKLLHYAMVINPSVVLVNDEVDYIRRYSQIREMRINKSISLLLNISPEAGIVRIPKMTIQPLVENAYDHGQFYDQPNGYLSISAFVKDSFLTISVENNGKHITPDVSDRCIQMFNTIRNRYNTILKSDFTLTDNDDVPLTLSSLLTEKNGQTFVSIGLTNVFVRLLLHFGSCDFNIKGTPFDSGKTIVSFRVPIDPKSNRQKEAIQ